MLMLDSQMLLAFAAVLTALSSLVWSVRRKR